MELQSVPGQRNHASGPSPSGKQRQLHQGSARPIGVAGQGILLNSENAHRSQCTHTHLPAIFLQTVNLFVFCSLPVCLFICVFPLSWTTDHCQIAMNALRLGNVAQCQNIVLAAGMILWCKLAIILASRLRTWCLVEMLHLVGITWKFSKTAPCCLRTWIPVGPNHPWVKKWLLFVDVAIRALTGVGRTVCEKALEPVCKVSK